MYISTAAAMYSSHGLHNITAVTEPFILKVKTVNSSFFSLHSNVWQIFQQYDGPPFLPNVHQFYIFFNKQT